MSDVSYASVNTIISNKGRRMRVEDKVLIGVQGVKTHANSYRFCALTAQKDCSGCGACRMATVYRTVTIHFESHRNQ